MPEEFTFNFPSYTKVWRSDTYSTISTDRQELSAAGRNVVVTGGGTGIGKAIAKAFAEAGAKSVSIFGRRVAPLQSAVVEIEKAAQSKGKKTQVHYASVDLIKEADCHKAFADISAKFGKISILVANAAVQPPGVPITGLPADEFMMSFEPNVRGAYNSVQAFIAHATPDAQLLNVSTAGATMSAFPTQSRYVVTKAAGLKLMQCFAAENPWLHVVHFHPGIVATEISIVKGQDTPELPGHFSVWLASPEGKFLRNKCIWANWDVDELKQRSDEIVNSNTFLWSVEGAPV